MQHFPTLGTLRSPPCLRPSRPALPQRLPILRRSRSLRPRRRLPPTLRTPAQTLHNPRIATTEIGDVYSADAQCTVHQGDWRQLFSQIPTESVDLTVTSPPYCIGKSYETTKTLDAFRDEHLAIIPKIVNITKPGGNICWQVGYHVTNAAVTPLDFIVHEIFSSFPQMVLRNRIIWAFQWAALWLSGRHEIVLWYSKGTPYHFDLDPIRLPQLYPGKKHHKGAKRGQLSGNPLGKNPGDVWAIPQVKASSVEKTEHPCQFPIGLVQGLIRALSPSGGLVLDPGLWNYGRRSSP